jgi:hypothetical protein
MQSFLLSLRHSPPCPRTPPCAHVGRNSISQYTPVNGRANVPVFHTATLLYAAFCTNAATPYMHSPGESDPGEYSTWVHSQHTTWRPPTHTLLQCWMSFGMLVARQSVASRMVNRVFLWRSVFDIWTEREERITLCMWRAYVLVLITIKLCYTD